MNSVSNLSNIQEYSPNCFPVRGNTLEKKRFSFSFKAQSKGWGEMGSNGQQWNERRQVRIIKVVSIKLDSFFFIYFMTLLFLFLAYISRQIKSF